MDSMPKRGDGRLMFKATKPHFIKIILDDTICSRKLIPRKFVRRYGSDLSSPALLKVPSGDKWKVELVKCDGEIWLKNGWQEFVEHYSLALGSFIIFEYEQNCLFNVIIIDKSASEIDYPLSIINGDNGKPNLEQEFPEPEIEENENEFSILCHSSPSRKTKGKSALPFPQAHKKIKVENPTENVNEHFPTGQFEGMSSKKRTLHGAVTRRKPLTAEEKANAFHRASTNFKSGNPYFMIAMPPSFHSRLNIPATAAREYFNKSGAVTLNTVDGKTWSVRYSYKEYSRNKLSAKLNNGWRKFAKENHLEVGDVCVFELINRIDITLKVVIFQHIKDANSNPSLGNSKQLKHEESPIHKQFNPGNSSKVLGAIEAAKNFTSVNPFFKVIIRPSNRRTSVPVPLNLVAKSTKQGTNKVILQVESRLWPVKLVRYQFYGTALLSGGWPKFSKENFLQVGDVCIFELINSEAVLLKVTIFRNVN
ncbi:B3 domain-containing transcription factor VRN1-like isoform X2 [Hevea brasiliensis]|uniref:B3 domain-containing transcription factor VRN1-like isoform X2 n=1 Tax=Hevea brasiliensis TaxID=3981 RepID=UPI0025EE97D8|nr:B3 domain-containing transcription factor VRN1-like isoform X2 [Hevea brasiliensis]